MEKVLAGIHPGDEEMFRPDVGDLFSVQEDRLAELAYGRCRRVWIDVDDRFVRWRFLLSDDGRGERREDQQDFHNF